MVVAKGIWGGGKGYGGASDCGAGGGGSGSSGGSGGGGGGSSLSSHKIYPGGLLPQGTSVQTAARTHACPLCVHMGMQGLPLTLSPPESAPNIESQTLSETEHQSSRAREAACMVNAPLLTWPLLIWQALLPKNVV
uniref:Uncharacterized protein n=1 Tax=Eutreptiella gymnastica TaxID=73025 RepID=A0A7S4G2G2_9EUGL|mmetsp:Transcript_91758/g.153791  ORF Transcript_91758/g.153791 Transcript_91758/m.153791 type:complete len:136 (+) Transcript_91758:345-752(+)|eukprot:CAMPEP_0174349616 /NCGR_PEP_ID=MMETSP0811_2-20130205/6389_1 /TAXON_ID=73025 ORGANISM="Eutreptiella gymnastica-like, Strain CCMP1594" /NCGR_SAMPLE_ID=MMETSP0811_2 /ASSEMBLY_ACC=CAM_ASM_000667 /LENGTH=135 /DNA_ID=CAMNT_0015477137 /DNA_START=334 /DNA_END=741 /DNA_ORIENTATION=-